MKRGNLAAACGACTAGVSVICMSSMGAAVAASAAAAGAGLAGMAGMGGMEAAQASPSAFFVLATVMEQMGLGFLNQLPNEVLQPLLVVLLTISAGAMYLAYRGHGRPGALVLTLVSALAIYLGIYVWMSEVVYFLSLAGLLVAAVWGYFQARSSELRVQR